MFRDAAVVPYCKLQLAPPHMTISQWGHHTIIHTSSINNKATQYTHTHLTLSA